MDRRTFIRGSVLALLVVSRLAEAQQAKTIFRIGIILGGTLVARQSQLEAFRQTMRDLGYAEGQNVVFEIRAPEREEDARFAEFADELVRLKVDVIFAFTTSGAQAAKKAAKEIPIVMGASGDPVALGFVESLARPGGFACAQEQQAGAIGLDLLPT